MKVNKSDDQSTELEYWYRTDSSGSREKDGDGDVMEQGREAEEEVVKGEQVTKRERRKTG